MNDMTVIVEDNALLARIYARMPVDVQLSFTPEQMAALGLATYEPATPHKVAIRKTFGLFGRRYYFALFMGRDRRGTRSALKEYADEFRADWRYVMSMLFILIVAGGGLALAASTAWSYAVLTVGGPYRPVSINEFLPK
jgi:hypothetical protein